VGNSRPADGGIQKNLRADIQSAEARQESERTSAASRRAVRQRTELGLKADHINVGMTVKEAIAVPRFIHIKAAKVGLELEYARRLRMN